METQLYATRTVLLVQAFMGDYVVATYDLRGLGGSEQPPVSVLPRRSPTVAVHEDTLTVAGLTISRQPFASGIDNNAEQRHISSNGHIYAAGL